jgi:hypothetical protein
MVTAQREHHAKAPEVGLSPTMISRNQVATAILAAIKSDKDSLAEMTLRGEQGAPLRDLIIGIKRMRLWMWRQEGMKS